jgi:hypothetical protein
VSKSVAKIFIVYSLSLVRFYTKDHEETRSSIVVSKPFDRFAHQSIPVKSKIAGEQIIRVSDCPTTATKRTSLSICDSAF